MSVSFKIERTLSSHKQSTITSNRQISNHLDSDSSDNDQPHHHHSNKNKNKRDIQFISDFDSTREPTNPNGHSKQQMLSIAALPDRDFRAIHLARKQKRAKIEMYRPEPVNSMGGYSRESNTNNNQIVDAEGLDKMNSKVIEGGLKPPTTTAKTQKAELVVLEDPEMDVDPQVSEPPISATPDKPLTMEERAVKELLAQANPESTQQMKIEAIHMRNEADLALGSNDGDDSELSGDSGDETAQFRRDVSKRPDSSTLEDYERIPVGQFGLALLKGMGWKEGTAATKRGRVGLVEAYVPQARPSLLGIGAKPLVESDPSDTKKTKPSKPDKKYVPLLRKVIDHGGKTRSRSRSPVNGNSSASPSSHDRSSSDSPSRSTRRGDRDSSSHRDRDSASHRSSRHHESRPHSRDDDRDERGERSHRDRHHEDSRDDRRSSHRSNDDSYHHRSSSSSKNYSHRPSSRDHKPSRYD